MKLRVLLTQAAVVAGTPINISAWNGVSVIYNSPDGGEVNVSVSFDNAQTNFIAISANTNDGDVVTVPSALPTGVLAPYGAVWLRVAESVAGTHHALVTEP